MRSEELRFPKKTEFGESANAGEVVSGANGEVVQDPYIMATFRYEVFY